MLKLNKFMLALAFIGGSAAAQASTESNDIGRVPDGKRGEKYDRIDGHRRMLGRLAASSATRDAPGRHGLPEARVPQAGWAVPTFLTRVMVNGLQSTLSVAYDIHTPLVPSAGLYRPAPTEAPGASRSLSSGRRGYLPVHIVT